MRFKNFYWDLSLVWLSYSVECSEILAYEVSMARVTVMLCSVTVVLRANVLWYLENRIQSMFPGPRVSDPKIPSRGRKREGHPVHRGLFGEGSLRPKNPL